jgi:hypothetical protein
MARVLIEFGTPAINDIYEILFVSKNLTKTTTVQTFEVCPMFEVT